jgi:hypothetical protein
VGAEETLASANRQSDHPASAAAACRYGSALVARFGDVGFTSIIGMVLRGGATPDSEIPFRLAAAGPRRALGKTVKDCANGTWNPCCRQGLEAGKARS